MSSTTVRMLPPGVAKPGTNPITVGGGIYGAAIGTALDVPFSAVDALEGNGWIVVAGHGGRGQANPGLVGSTANRPTATNPGSNQAMQPGTQYLDTTVGGIVVWDGAAWRDPVTGASA